MALKHEHILIIADIEGSSLCRNYEMSSFMTESWPEACLGMSQDVAIVADALFNFGVKSVTVKDFHRTGYNIFPEYLNRKARLVQGYKRGPVPGIGNSSPATGLIMMGMHAPSGSGGFLSHTLTSRISRLEVNGKLMSEAQLFSASLAPFEVIPLFFSGCPVACHHALQSLEGIQCFPINKCADPKHFNPDQWRLEMAREAVKSLSNEKAEPHRPAGPFHAAVTMRDGEPVARSLGRRWKLKTVSDTIILENDTIQELYLSLMRICYLTPFLQKALPIGLQLFNARGKFGLWWARQQLIKAGRC